LRLGREIVEKKLNNLLYILTILLITVFLQSGCKEKKETIKAYGTIEATEINISAKVTGIIENLVKEGEKVKKGQPIIWLDREELLQQVAQAEAALKVAELQLGQAKKMAELQQSQVENQINLAKTNLRATKYQVNQADASFILQNTQTDTQITQATARLAESLAIYEQAKKALELQVADTESKISQAKAALNLANSNLEMLLTGARPQEKAQAKATYEQAITNYENASKDLERAKNLFDQGVIPAQQLDKAETIYKNAEDALEIAKQNLSLVEEGARSEVIEMAKQQVAQAKANLQAAEATKALVEQRKKQLEIAAKQVEEANAALKLAKSGVLQNDIKNKQLLITQAQLEQAQSNYKLAQDSLKMVEIKKKDVEVATAIVQQRKAALELAKTQLRNSIVYSPIDGTVKLKVAEIGELIPAGSTILKLADLDNIWVSVYLPEDQYGRVALNDKAKITVDSWPGEEFLGFVSYIAEEAQFTPKNIQTKNDRVTLTYEVKVSVTNTQQKLIPGMPADVEILVKTH